ncbi:MAG: mechanosensitive ion channel family protein [Pseudomonadales bacterium]|nr:mechanosensitive ion channel family protein [Pseudomonadales bacterium]
MENDIQAIQKAGEVVSEFVINYGFQFIGALIIIVLGWKIAQWIGELIFKLCVRTDMDVTLAKFFGGLAKSIILVFVGIIALGKFGISMTPFIAALGALAFGSTFALQGPLSNYGAGLNIILSRPFVVGDTIRVQGVTGIVEEIKLAQTELINEDGEIITIPNKCIIGEVLVNSHLNLIAEKEIGIAYDVDPEIAIKAIHAGIAKIEGVASDPKPLVGIDNFGSSSIQLGIRYWIPTARYFELMYETNNEILKSLNDASIEVACPKQIVQIAK